MRRRWQPRPSLLKGNQGGNALKWLPAHFNFEKKTVCFFVTVAIRMEHFVPKSGKGRKFHIGPVCWWNQPCACGSTPRNHRPIFLPFQIPLPSPGWQRHFHGNADRAYNTLHFASKVVCQGAPLETPDNKTVWTPRTFPCLMFRLFCCQQPVSRSAFCALVHNFSV